MPPTSHIPNPISMSNRSKGLYQHTLWKYLLLKLAAPSRPGCRTHPIKIIFYRLKHQTRIMPNFQKQLYFLILSASLPVPKYFPADLC